MRRTLTIALGAVATCAALATVPSLASASNCSYDPAAKSVTVTHSATPGETLEVLQVFGQIQHRDFGAFRQCLSPGEQVATVSNTDKIKIVAAPGSAPLFQATMVEVVNGPLGPGATPEASGRSEIEIAVLTGTGGDRLTLAGSEGDDSIRVGMGTGLQFLSSQADLNGDGDSDVAMTQAGSIRVFGKGGDDFLSGQGFPDAATPSIRPMTINGSTGDDEIFGGTAADVLRGDAGFDFFSTKDGVADTLAGGADFDSASSDLVLDSFNSVENLQR